MKAVINISKSLNEEEVARVLFKENLKNQYKIIHKRYFKDMLITIRSSLQNILNIPLEDLDIYFDFLMEIQTVINKFTQEKNTSFKTYLLKCLKYFTFNKIRFWTNEKRKVVNSIDSLENYDVEDLSSSIEQENWILKYDYKIFLDKNKKYEKVLNNISLNNIFMTKHKQNNYIKYFEKNFIS